MATITSTSTQAQIAAAYLDNCGYFEDASVTMAKAFVTACTAMLREGGEAGQAYLMPGGLLGALTYFRQQALAKHYPSHNQTHPHRRPPTIAFAVTSTQARFSTFDSRLSTLVPSFYPPAPFLVPLVSLW